MEERIRLGNLFDFYGELLGAHQRRICEASLLEDLSLAEIAEEMDMSRQGVHNHLVRAEKSLEEYESKLRLYDRFLRIRGLVSDIDGSLETADPDIAGPIREKLDAILDEL